MINGSFFSTFLPQKYSKVKICDFDRLFSFDSCFLDFSLHFTKIGTYKAYIRLRCCSHCNILCNCTDTANLKTSFKFHWLQESFPVKVRLNDFNFNFRMYTTIVFLLLAAFYPRKRRTRILQRAALEHVYKAYAIYGMML